MRQLRTPLQRYGNVRWHKRPRHEKGRSGWLGWTRKLFWSWGLWVIVAIALKGAEHENAAVSCIAVAFVFYLLSSQEHVPHYGLDPNFDIRSHEFLTSVVGTTGVPFVNHNHVTILNNGEQFYPAMLEAVAGAQNSITMEAYIYWAGD